MFLKESILESNKELDQNAVLSTFLTYDARSSVYTFYRPSNTCPLSQRVGFNPIDSWWLCSSLGYTFRMKKDLMEFLR